MSYAPPTGPPPQNYGHGGYQSNGYYDQVQQQQPYYPPPPPQMPPSNSYAQQYNGGKQGPQGDFSQYGQAEKFNDIKPKWNDLIFTILFIAQLAGFIALSVISLRSLKPSSSHAGLGNQNTGVTLNMSTAYLLSIIAGAGFVFSIIFLAIVRAFTKVILEITLFLSVAFSVAYAVYLWILKSYGGAIVFTIFAIISVLAYFPMRKRIPFSRELLIFVLKIANHHWSVYVIAIAGALLQMAWSVYWAFAIVAIYQRFEPEAEGSASNASSAKVTGLVVFGAFSFYWTSQFILNFFLTVEAGIFGNYYFSGPGGKSVAWGAFKRAATYSMGSIAFGSLIVAILDLLRAIFTAIRQNQQAEGDACGTILACFAECCIGCIANLAEYFNRYAMIEIALYGKPYIQASKDVWRMFKDRGIDALVNDCLVNNIWTFGSYAVGALCSAFAFIYLRVVSPSYVEANPNLQSVLMLYAFAIGFFISHTLGYGALSSGVSTIFVGLGEDPMALAERDPALFEIIRQTYPQVVTPV